MKYRCIRQPETGLLIVNAEVDGRHDLKMVFDTGATHTTIDSNAFHLSGYDLRERIDTVLIETANGIVEADVFKLGNFSSLGINQDNFSIQVYDFLTHGIYSDYNGVLGLDFLEGRKFCIDLDKNEIEIN